MSLWDSEDRLIVYLTESVTFSDENDFGVLTLRPGAAVITSATLWNSKPVLSSIRPIELPHFYACVSTRSLTV